MFSTSRGLRQGIHSVSKASSDKVSGSDRPFDKCDINRSNKGPGRVYEIGEIEV